MCILLKLDYAKFGVSNLFFSKVIEEKPLGVWLDSPPLGAGRVNPPMAKKGGGGGFSSFSPEWEELFCKLNF